jgi:uncharacterized protein (DUF2062 family)
MSDQILPRPLSPTVGLVASARGVLRCRVFLPLLRLLKNGVTPERLGWSLAIALVVGVNPLLGTTTVLMLLLAWMFGLNQVASQIGIHLMWPVQWLLFLPFVNAGIFVFRTSRLPMTKAEIFHLSHKHPLMLIHVLWQWEWHALVVWAVFAVCAAPLLASCIRRMLVHSMRHHADLLRQA